MRRFIALACVAVGALAASGASSAGQAQQVLTCGGLGTVTITAASTTNDNSVAWGTGHVSSSLHLIPVSFTFTATDLTQGGVVVGSFTQAKGQGHGMSNASTVTCSTPSQVGTAAELGAQIPGVNPSDTLQLDFSAQAVAQP